MAEAPDYAFYRDSYGGSASEGEFDSNLPGALAHVGWLIGWNEVTDETETAYKRAVCACVDVFRQYGEGPLEGFTIGSFSVSAGSGGGTGRSLATDAATEELATSGLLWAGVR